VLYPLNRLQDLLDRFHYPNCIKTIIDRLVALKKGLDVSGFSEMPQRLEDPHPLERLRNRKRLMAILYEEVTAPYVKSPSCCD
jgi:hypothetical protein